MLKTNCFIHGAMETSRFKGAVTLFKKLYHWIMREADHPRALWVLAGISFLEAFMLPVPLDVISAPIMLANRRRIWLVVATLSVSSVLGGIMGYTIGRFFYEELGRPILIAYGYSETYTEIASTFQSRGWEFIIVGGMLLSYEVVTITSGFAGIPFIVFIVASALARGGRFIIVGLLFYLFGPSVRIFLDKYLAPVVWITLAAIIAGFIISRWLF